MYRTSRSRRIGMIGQMTAPIRAQASVSAANCHRLGSWAETMPARRTPSSSSPPANRSTSAASWR